MNGSVLCTDELGASLVGDLHAISTRWAYFAADVHRGSTQDLVGSIRTPLAQVIENVLVDLWNQAKAPQDPTDVEDDGSALCDVVKVNHALSDR